MRSAEQHVLHGTSSSDCGSRQPTALRKSIRQSTAPAGLKRDSYARISRAEACIEASGRGDGRSEVVRALRLLGATDVDAAAAAGEGDLAVGQGKERVVAALGRRYGPGATWCRCRIRMLPARTASPPNFFSPRPRESLNRP